MSHFIQAETPAPMCQLKSPNYSASPRGWSPADLLNRGIWVSSSLTSLGLHLTLPTFHRWTGLIKPDAPVLSPGVPLGKTAGHLLSLCCAMSLEGMHCGRKHTHDQRNRTTSKTCRRFGDPDLEPVLLVTSILSSTPPGRRLHVVLPLLLMGWTPRKSARDACPNVDAEPPSCTCVPSSCLPSPSTEHRLQPVGATSASPHPCPAPRPPPALSPSLSSPIVTC